MTFLLVVLLLFPESIQFILFNDLQGSPNSNFGCAANIFLIALRERESTGESLAQNRWEVGTQNPGECAITLDITLQMAIQQVDN